MLNSGADNTLANKAKKTSEFSSLCVFTTMILWLLCRILPFFKRKIKTFLDGCWWHWLLSEIWRPVLLPTSRLQSMDDRLFRICLSIFLKFTCCLDIWWEPLWKLHQHSCRLANKKITYLIYSWIMFFFFSSAWSDCSQLARKHFYHGPWHHIQTHKLPFGLRKRHTMFYCACNVKPSASVS